MRWEAAPLLTLDAAGAPLAAVEEMGLSGKKQGHNNKQFHTPYCHTLGDAAVSWDLALIWHRHKVSACLPLLTSLHGVSAATVPLDAGGLGRAAALANRWGTLFACYQIETLHTLCTLLQVG